MESGAKGELRCTRWKERGGSVQPGDQEVDVVDQRSLAGGELCQLGARRCLFVVEVGEVVDCGDEELERLGFVVGRAKDGVCVDDSDDVPHGLTELRGTGIHDARQGGHRPRQLMSGHQASAMRRVNGRLSERTSRARRALES